MRLLHRSSKIGGGGGGRALRRVGSSPRAPAPPRQHLLSKSDSIKKRSGATAKGSKRARLRAGLAAALQELRLSGRGRRHGRAGAAAGVGAGGASTCSGAGAAAALPVAVAVAVGTEEGSASRATTIGGGRRRAGWPPLVLLLLPVLALVCVVALGRAPAVCCCTCAAWLCRDPSATAAGERHRSDGALHSHAGDGSGSSSRGG